MMQINLELDDNDELSRVLPRHGSTIMTLQPNLQSARIEFSDLHAKRIIEAGPYEVRESDVLAFAREFDPQWFHVDPQAALTGEFAGVIASGWHTCAIAMRMVVDSVLKNADILASPGLKYLRWPHPVRPRDSLTLKITVLEARVSASRPDLGILQWRWQLFNQHQIEVLDTENTTLFNLKGTSDSGPASASS